jgi:transcription-repair coupling factor (superfamily II helicase)
MDAYIPESYISSPSARIDAYRKISLIRNNEDMLDITDELIDRYGNTPLPVTNLLNISLIRALGSKCGISKIECKSNSVIYFPRVFDQKMWLQLIKQNNGKYLTAVSSNPYVQEKIRPGEKLLRSILKTLEEYLKLLDERS